MRDPLNKMDIITNRIQAVVHISIRLASTDSNVGTVVNKAVSVVCSISDLVVLAILRVPISSCFAVTKFERSSSVATVVVAVSISTALIFE